LDSPVLKVTLSHPPEQVNEHTFLLKTESNLQSQEFAKIKQTFVNWLCSELNNSLIDIITEVSQTDTPSEQRFLTASEKLAEMGNKNPAVNLLKQKFNLDLREL
jgi:6-phosphogluconate dehydrogenase